ncbi:MAG: efflux RND transporter periplasmic adaptor subunit [Candidatus Liptonbacteria bacterium]|nr:efflux RND transporter periplasmic adaptor subunit [Candidatus Liptonbacteria bacterium]
MRPYVAALIAIAAASGGFWYFSGGGEPAGETITVTRGNVVQEVSITGKVRPVQEVQLSFEKSGKISKIYVNVGDKVSAGKSLVSLENGDLLSSLNKAKAQLKIDEAKLDELLNGTREEDLDVKRSELEKAKQELENYYNDVLNILNNAFVNSDDAVRVKTAGIFSGYKTTAYKITYVDCSGESKYQAELLRAKSETELDTWKNELNLLSNASGRSQLEKALVDGSAHLAVVQELLIRISETLTTGCTGNDASLDTYRKNISTARTNVISSMTDINNLEQNIAAQKIAVTKIDNELKLKLAGTNPEQINAQRAQVEYSAASVKGAEAELAKTVIQAPFSGTVTEQDGKVGAVISLNSPIVSMISEAQYEIETFIPEADITKIKVGNVARVTLDAYGSEVVFEAAVALIPPSETVIEGVPTYKTIFKFTKDSEQIKSGMTANIDIETGRKTDVIVIPQRSVISRGGETMARVLLKDGAVSETPVTTGLRGSSGEIEIVSGLNEGDQVLLFSK